MSHFRSFVSFQDTISTKSIFNCDVFVRSCFHLFSKPANKIKQRGKLKLIFDLNFWTRALECQCLRLKHDSIVHQNFLRTISTSLKHPPPTKIPFESIQNNVDQHFQLWKKQVKRFPGETTPPKFSIDPEKCWLKNSFLLGLGNFSGANCSTPRCPGDVPLGLVQHLKMPKIVVMTWRSCVVSYEIPWLCL